MKNKLLISIIFFSLLSVWAFAHGTEKHDDKEMKTVKIEAPKKIKEDATKEEVIKYEKKKKQYEVLQNKYKKINADYLKDIKPIFETKCFNCHSNTINYPFYYKIPGVKTMIDKDIKEAKTHIDFSKDFPFISHETPINDLKSLKKIALEGGMPPLRYIVAHWDSKLSEKDKKAMLIWTNNAIELLRKD